MDIEKLRSKPHLSASAINDYVECGLLYKLSRIDGFNKEFIPEALIFGSAVHEALREFYKERMNDTTLSSEELITRFERIWREKAEGNDAISYKDGKDFTILLNEGKSLLGTYYKNLRDDHFRVLAVEEPFEFSLEGLDIPVIGIIDLLEEDESGTLIITDHKTAGKSYTSREVDGNFQLTIYHMAAKSNGYADREILLKLDCLIKTKTPRFEAYYTTRSEKDERRAMRKILAVANGIEKAVFVPNDTSWKCKDCTYKTHCNDWFGG
jgi:putative RecB family exonuclease